MNCDNVGCDDPDCQDCCLHFEEDHGICLDCKKDILDTLISKVDFND